MVDMVAAVDHVDGRVHLDAADLGAGQILLVVDVVDVVVLDDGEDTAQMAYDTGLIAVMDVAATHDMGTDPLLGPAFILGLADAVTLGLGAILVLFVQPLVVVVRLQILAQGDAGAFGLIDFAVLDDPALGPVRTDHTFLVRGRRSPLGSRLADGESGQGDKAYAFLAGIEAVFAHAQFHFFLVGVQALEVGIEHGGISRLILLCIPGIDGEITIPGRLGRYGMQDFFQLCHFVHGFMVEVHVAQMRNERGNEPVAGDQGGIGVALACKKTVRNACLPGGTLHKFPSGQGFRTGDDRLERLRGTIGDPGFFRTRVDRVYIFTIDTRCNDDFIPRDGDLGRFRDGLEGCILCSFAKDCCILIYIVFHKTSTSF